MVTVKYLTGWNAHLLSKSQNIQLTHFQAKPSDFQKIISEIIYYFNRKDFFYGLFQAMAYSGVSPFIATHDYCIKVLHCDSFGIVEMNISPIYHLGLEYPEDYKAKHGRDLDKEAVVGLLAKPLAETFPLEQHHTAYSYGVDAGILFKDSHISHNKKLTLKLEETREGVLVILVCENQMSSTKLTWAEIGLTENIALESCERGTEMMLGDWAVKF